MTAKGRKQHREPLLDELSDENEDERRDFADQSRNLFESEHGPVMGTDGDDNPEYTQPKPKFDGDKLEQGDISDPVQAKLTSNPAGEIADAGHGFIVNDPRSRPWKTAPRTHCAYCGGEMPKPDVSKYKCEFDPDAPAAELALIGEGQPKDAADRRWDAVDTCWTLGHRAATARVVAAVCWAASALGALSAGKWRLAMSETPVSLRNTAARSAGGWQTPSAAGGNERRPEPRNAGRNRRPSQRIEG